MELTRSGSSAASRGSSDYFTGTVWADVIVNAPSPARVRAARVRFEPGARTAWHTHPRTNTARRFRRWPRAGLGRTGSGDKSRR